MYCPHCGSDHIESTMRGPVILVRRVDKLSREIDGIRANNHRCVDCGKTIEPEVLVEQVRAEATV